MSAFSYENSKGTTYYLHARARKVASGKTVTLYFFAKKPGRGVVAELPEGYKVTESSRTGLPILKKKSGLFGLF
jgi:hypothetical protein